MLKDLQDPTKEKKALEMLLQEASSNRSIKHVVKEAFSFKEVFALLLKTLKADLASDEYISQRAAKAKGEGVVLEAPLFTEICESSFKTPYPYPTIEEIKAVLHRCEL